MKAFVYCDYGAPDVLRLANVAAPTPGDGQVLVSVRAAGINQLEAHHLHGTPYVMRLDIGLRKPKNIRIGADFAGVVAAVGPHVTLFKPGDEVFGARNGALAEQVVVAETSVVRKPTNITFEQAAAVPVAAVTALQAVRDHGHVQPGQSVLVNGASGGVGTFAVQIAKAFGGGVTGVSSTRNVDLVRSLGAAVTIDYTKQDYTQGTESYDVIVDMVGNHTLRENRRVLTPAGIYVMVGGPEGHWIAPLDRAVQMIVYSKFVSQTFVIFLANVTSAELTTLRDLMQAGTVTPVIDRRYPFSELPEAMRYLETGRAHGKIVLTVAP
ncbi:MAG: NAD(P)-dependent alcohol dehydrogenase [Acidobacteriota bacterium]